MTVKQPYRFLFLLLSLVVGQNLFAQTNLYNLGQEITIRNGISVTVRGDLVNDVKGTKQGEIASAGEVRLEKNLINNTNNNVFVTNAGRVVFYGDSLQEIRSDSVVHFHTLEIDKPSEELQLQVDIQVLDTLLLSDGNLHMNEHDIEFDFKGQLVGETNAKRLYGELSYVFAQRSLSGDVTNIAGLGLSIESTVSLGTTKITRAHDAQGGASNGSVKRYFQLEPTTLNQKLDKVSMAYLDTNEIIGLDEGKFSLWMSNNDGLVWHRQTSTPFAGADFVDGTDVTLNGSTLLLTLAESDCDSLPEVNLGADTMYLCAGDSLEIDAKNPGLFFKWNTTEISQKIKVTTAGDYGVVVTDANGCVGVDTSTVIIKPYPTLAFKVASVCQNDSSYFVNTSAITEDTLAYFWDFGDTKIAGDTSREMSPSYLYDTSSVYSVRLTVTSEYGCVVDSAASTIVHPNPKAEFTATSVCIDSVTMYSNNSSITSGGMLYRWDFGNLTSIADTTENSNPTYVFDTAGTYQTQLIAISNAACRDTIEKNITVHPRPEPNFTFVEVGEKESIQLQNTSSIKSGNMSYNWSFGDGVSTTVATPTKSYTSFGSYTILLKATSDFACSNTLSQIINISDIPAASFTMKDTCAASIVSFTNTSTVNGGDALSYEWKFGDGTTSNDATPTKSYSTAGDYTVWLIATSSNNNVDSTSQEITVHPNPVTAFSFTNKCAEERVNFVNQSFVTSGFNQYLWDFGDGNTSSFGSPNNTYSTDGDYTVTLLATSNFGCTSTLQKTVTIHPLPVLDFGGAITTCGDSIILDAENDGSSYLWNTSESSQIITAKTSGTYSVTVTTTNTCKLSTAVAVSLNSLFTPNLGDDRAACVQTILDAGNPNSSYTWNTGEISRTISTTESGQYFVEIIDQNGCIGADTINITIHQNPTVDLGNDTTICSGDEVILDAQNGTASFDWSTGDTDQTISVSQSGSYSVIVTDVNNCKASSSITLGLFSLPIVALGNDRSVCKSTTLRAKNTGASYLWSDGSTADTLFVESGGSYFVKVTNGNECSNSDTINISILAKPIVDLGDDQTVCNNETVILDAGTDGNEYLWNTSAISQKLFAQASGTYSVTVTNSDNCSSSDQVKVTVLDQVEVNIGQDFTLCAGKSVTLDPEIANATYEWNTTADTTYGTTQTIVANKAGKYWVEVTTSDNCVGSDTIKIGATSNTVVAQFLSNSLVDVGDTVQFLDLSTPDSLNYLWNFDDGVVTVEQDPLHAYFVAGSYNVSLSVSNELCSDQVIKEIIVRDLKQVPLEPEVASFFEIIEFIVYPSPFTEGDEVQYRIEFNQSKIVQLYLYDMNGRLLYNIEAEGSELEAILPMDGADNGVYILKLVVDNQSEIFRIQKL